MASCTQSEENQGDLISLLSVLGIIHYLIWGFISINFNSLDSIQPWLHVAENIFLMLTGNVSNFHAP